MWDKKNHLKTCIVNGMVDTFVTVLYMGLPRVVIFLHNRRPLIKLESESHVQHAEQNNTFMYG